MILNQVVEDIEKVCHIQEQQLYLTSFWELSPIVVKSCAAHNSKTLRYFHDTLPIGRGH